MTDINIIPPYPALLLQTWLDGTQRSLIVVSDLHIGFATWFQPNNVLIDWYQVFQETESELERILELNRADSIVILGDLKNTISKIDREDWKIIPRFFELLSKVCHIYFIPGNHDGNMRFLLPSVVSNIGVNGMTVDDTLLIHGHTLPSKMKSSVSKIVLGHAHPTFMKADSIANGQKVWVFVKAHKKSIFPGSEGLIDLILMPSFNRSVARQRWSRTHGSKIPLLRRMMKLDAIESCLILTTDGSILGNEDLLLNIL
jgi:putative SbcD/Mre11-related phosphoesterase